MAIRSDPRVLRFAIPRSAHSDIAFPLLEAVRSLPHATWYCADPAAFRSVLLNVDGDVFAFAEGMAGITARLPDDAYRACMADGASDREAELGKGWVFLPLLENDARFLARLPSLMRKAYALACEEAGRPGQ